jgi:CHAT domain-containing protein
MEILRDYNNDRASMLSTGDQYRSAAYDRPTFDLFLTLALDQKMSGEKIYEQVLASRGQVFLKERWLGLQSRDPEIAKHANELRDVVLQLDARLQDRPKDPVGRTVADAEIQTLTEKRSRLQQELGSLAAARTGARMTAYTLKQVRNVLPEDVAIVEFVNFTFATPPRNFKRPTSVTHTLAFIVRQAGIIEVVDLNSSEKIDVAVQRWRLALGADDSKAVPDSARLIRSLGSEREEAQTVRKLVWDPIEAENRLKGISIVLVSADGSLTGVPFAALPESGEKRFLMQRIGVVTLPAPQLLPEWLPGKPETNLILKGKTAQDLLVVGGVDYDHVPTATNGETLGNTVEKENRRTFEKLGQSGPEAENVQRKFKRAFPDINSHSLTGIDASKDKFRQLVAQSRWIHLATHGFYAPKDYLKAFGDQFLDLVSGGPSGTQHGTDPSVAAVFAGFALSGANIIHHASDNRLKNENGIMTALEVGTLDLQVTDCVFISACWGGSGLPIPGEGVLSLQRSFASAGAKTVIAALWKVDDKATEMLVEEYYKNLWGTDGYPQVGKLKALCNAQSTVAERFLPDGGQRRGFGKPSGTSDEPIKPADGPRILPFYWAAFVLSGDWR